MLTARPGALPRLAVLYRQSAAAESSRQAQVRYSSVAAASRPDDLDHSASSLAHDPIHTPAPRPSLPPLSAPPTPRPAFASPFPPDDPLTVAERFRRTVHEDPVRAFLALRTLDPERLRALGARDVKTLLFQLVQLARGRAREGGARDLSAIGPAEAAECLSIVRAVLHSRPSAPGARDAGLGRILHGRALRALLRAAAVLGADAFAAEVFFERLDAQLRHPGVRVLDVQGVALDLAAEHRWLLAARLLDPARVPADVWTPRTTAVGMRAALSARRPWVARALFARLAPGEAGADAHCAHVSALLELGDVGAAKAALVAAGEAGVPPEGVQRALLSAREGMEPAVRSSLARLGLAPGTGVLNAFVRRRLAANDLAGAEAVLAEFAGVGTGTAPPDAETGGLLLALAARRGDLPAARAYWKKLAAHPALVHEKSVAALLRALARLGAPATAIGLFEAAVRRAPPPEGWSLPAAFRPGVWVANAAMQAALTSEGYAGFTRVAELMRAARIEPDERTVRMTLEFAAAHLVSSPTRLAHLFRDLLAKSSAPPTGDQLAVMLGEVARVALRDPAQAKRYLGSEKVPGGQVPMSGSLKALLAERIRQVNESGQKSGPRALGTRLLFDALALDGAWPANAVRQTWQAYVLDGWVPSEANYISLIRAYAHIGDLAAAADVLAYAREEGQPPTAAMLTALIVAYSQAGDWAQARRIYDRIDAPDAPAFTAMLRTYIKAGQWGRAVRLARADFARLPAADERALRAVAHALHARDPAGSVFWTAHHAITAKGGDAADFSESRAKYPLSPGLRRVTRWNLKRLQKAGRGPVEGDERGRQLEGEKGGAGDMGEEERRMAAVRLATRMLQDDDVARPPARRRRPTLTEKHIREIVGQLDVNAEEKTHST